MAALSFFVGKGGVGKTTLAAAYAVYEAAKHRKPAVLLLSTDPAHSLADVFDVRLGSERRRLRDAGGAANLTVWQIDAERQFCKFLDRYREPIVSLLENGTMFSRAEIEPLLDTTLPGMAEMAALLAIHEALTSGRYDEIVVDTAPIGHTLRLFEMPEYFARFLDLLEVAGRRDQVLAAHFGGAARPANPFIAEWRSMVAAVQEGLHQPESRIVMVTTPEGFALNESVRTTRAMAEAPDPLHVTEVVLNRAVRQAGGCATCRQRARATQSARHFLSRNFPGLPQHVAQDAGAPVVGTATLLAFAEHVFAGRRLRMRASPPKAGDSMRPERVPWPLLKAPLTWTIGKGGVGKTTISAALAANERRHERSRRVTICSTDPAPSLDDVFQQAIGDRPVAVLGDPKLRAVEVDAAAHFRAWAGEMKDKINRAFTSEARGVHLDLSFERRILLALLDMVPPGLDEIVAIFRVLDLLEKGQALVIDMAPTGHALELLRMPDRILLWSRLLLKSLAAHRRMALARDVAVQIARVSQRVRELAAMLQDVKRSCIVPVMLAEPLPDRETIRLLRSLDELGISTPWLFVNRVVFAKDAGRCRRCGTAQRWQEATLAALQRRREDKKIYIVRNRVGEIAGAAALRSFLGELWQIK